MKSPEQGAGQSRPKPKVEPGADYYTRLGVSSSATQAEIAAAFRDISKQLHPDAQGGGDSEKMKLLSEAYATLKDPVKRAKYVAPNAPNFSRPRQDDAQRAKSAYEDAARTRAHATRSPDFDEYYRQQRAKAEPHQEKAKPEVDPEKVKNDAIGEASQGAYYFKVFVDKLKRNGYQGAERLILEPAVERVIISNALQEAKLGAYSYNSYVEKWAKEANFDRNKIDTHPDMFKLVKANLIEEAKQGTYSFTSSLDKWLKGNSKFTRSMFVTLPEVKQVVKNQAAEEQKMGDYSYRSYVAKWKAAGVEI